MRSAPPNASSTAPALRRSSSAGAKTPALVRRGSASPAPASLEPPASSLLMLNSFYAVDETALHVSDGGCSELRLVTHRATGQPAVVRAVRLHPAPTVAPRAAVELWRRVESRHVVSLFDSFATETHALVVMEAVHGLSLARVLSEHGLSREEARCVFKQLAHALRAMHAASVCHRSLCLESVMLQEGVAPRAVVVGLDALGGCEAGKLLTRRVTPWPFCPPEALPSAAKPAAAKPAAAKPAAAKPSAAAAATTGGAAGGDGGYSGSALDVWSLGVLLHTMLVGALPFTTPDAVRAGGYAPPAALDADARELLARMLDADPAARAKAADVCAHAYVADAPVVADEGGLAAELDPDVVAHMATLGYAPDDVRAALEARVASESDASAAYRALLCAKRLFVDRCAEGEEVPREVALDPAAATAAATLVDDVAALAPKEPEAAAATSPTVA